MPLIDVTDILTDPDFADANAITVFRSTQTINGFGEGVTTASTFTITGVVTPASTASINRLPDGSYLTGAITVHTIYPLTAGGESLASDEIVWSGRRYIVSVIDDLTSFGTGYVAATCTLKTLNP